MESNRIKSISTDELWELYEQVSSILFKRIEAEPKRPNLKNGSAN
jgi:hypothetical protein